VPACYANRDPRGHSLGLSGTRPSGPQQK